TVHPHHGGVCAVTALLQRGEHVHGNLHAVGAAAIAGLAVLHHALAACFENAVGSSLGCDVSGVIRDRMVFVAIAHVQLRSACGVHGNNLARDLVSGLLCACCAGRCGRGNCEHENGMSCCAHAEATGAAECLHCEHLRKV